MVGRLVPKPASLLGLVLFLWTTRVESSTSSIDWEDFSKDLGSGVLREIGSVEAIYEECSASIIAFGGAALPSVANGTCSFAGACVYENCGVVAGGDPSAMLVYGTACPADSCGDAALCFDHTSGACGEDGTIVEPLCLDASPFCDGCFPNSRCSKPQDPDDTSGVLVESAACPGMGCSEANLCFSHSLGLCKEDGSMPGECSEAMSCSACFPNSRCGSSSGTTPTDTTSDSSTTTAEDDPSAVLVTSLACPSFFASGGCNEAGVCFSHGSGLCNEDGSMAEDCAMASACVFCYPNSRCGMTDPLADGDSNSTSAAEDETNQESGLFVEGGACTSDFAACVAAEACYDHEAGLCGADGSLAATCSEAAPCGVCFPNSRCGQTSIKSSLFVEGGACTADFAPCADAAPCFDHAIGACGDDGSLAAECAEAAPCGVCFPNSRCGQAADQSSDQSGLFVEGGACTADFATCADGALCFDHGMGLCGDDGSLAAECAEAAPCGVCFPNSRCGGGAASAGAAGEVTPSFPTIDAEKNLPLYSVVATSLEHVELTVKFAASNDIPLSVKSTGASYSLANQDNDNLLLSMSDFPKHSSGVSSSAPSAITETGGIIENYVDACGTKHGPVMEIGGGETWGDVFQSLAAYNSNRGEDETKYMLSSGAAVTVGASGGWLMGGGLGPFDRSMGLGIDNVLAYKVVTPDGSAVVANECDSETSDLFWALRGGGGGNFGVVVSQISRVHPIKPLVRANVIWMGAPGVKANTEAIPAGMTISGDMIPDTLARGSIGTRQPNLAWTKPESDAPPMEQLDKWYDAMLTVLNPVTMDPNLDGYYGVGCAWAGGFMCADLYFLGTMEEFESTVLAPLRETLGITAMPDAPPTETGPGAAGTGPDFVYIAQQYTEGYYSYASQDCVSAEAGSPQEFVCTDLGYPSANGYSEDAQVDQGGFETRLSWMIPDYIFGTGTAGNPPDQETIDRAKALFAEPLFQGVVGHVLGGVINDVAEDSTSTGPVMRTSALEGLFPFQWIKAIGIQESIDVLDKHLPAGKSAPIFNHDARNLDLLDLLGDWQELYWGSNLPMLREIKAKYDPDNVFQCRDCLTLDNDDGNDDDASSAPGARRVFATSIAMLLGSILLA